MSPRRSSHLSDARKANAAVEACFEAGIETLKRNPQDLHCVILSEPYDTITPYDGNKPAIALMSDMSLQNNAGIEVLTRALRRVLSPEGAKRAGRQFSEQKVGPSSHRIVSLKHGPGA